MKYSLILCLFGLLILDSNSVAVINCDEKNNPCISSVINCDERTEPGDDCEIHCDGKNACKNSQIICPTATGADCSLFCDSSNGKDPCEKVHFDARLSNEANVLVSCVGEDACQNIFIDARTEKIALNVTATIAIDTTIDDDDTDDGTSPGVMTNAEIHCPVNESFCGVQCIGKNSCQNSKLNAGNSNHITLYAEFQGTHAFQNGFLSLPADSDIHILCDMDKNDDDKATACESAVFDGHDTAFGSEIEIECFGNTACINTQIIANKESNFLSVNGGQGDRVLSQSKIFCPWTTLNHKRNGKDNCFIKVFGNGTNMLLNTKIYALELFRDLHLECDYGQSVSDNCYDETEHDSRPSAYCKPFGHYDECVLSIYPILRDSWTCANSEQTTCLDYEYNSQQFESTKGVDDVDDDIMNKNLSSVGINKGKLAMSCVIVTLCLLGMGVCVFKRHKIKDCLKNERTVVEDGNSTTVFVGGISNKGKNTYASLEDSNEENDIFSSDQVNESMIDTSDSD